MIKDSNGRMRSERTPEEMAKLLRDEIANLTPEEREAVLLCLRELDDPAFKGQAQGDGGPVRILDALSEGEYVRPMVDIRTFINDPYYLGDTCSNLYPKLQDDMVELFEGGYRECILCLHPDTMIPLMDGSVKTLRELAEQWKINQNPFWVYSISKDGSIVPALAEAPRETGEDDYYRVVLDDETSFVANARHQMVMRDGEKRMVSDMSPGDSIMPFSTKISKGTDDKRRIKGYELVLQPSTNGWEYTHAISANHGRKKKIESKSETIHHVNFNKIDNRPENLMPMTWSDHQSLHAKSRKEYLAANPEVRSRTAASARDRAADPSSPFRVAHREFMNSEDGRALARSNLSKAIIPPEEYRRRGAAACDVRWNGPKSEEFRIAASSRMAARNVAATGIKSKRSKDDEIAVVEVIKNGAKTARAAAYALGWTEGKVYKVLYRAGERPKELFAKNNHFVKSISMIGRGPVYCMTVPQTSNFAICTEKEDGTSSRSGVFSSNTGSIGYGKTFFASIAMCRILYELSCMRNIHRSLGIAKDSNITLVGMSVNEQLAQKVVFENIATKIGQSPYFLEHFPFEETKKELRFPHSVWVAARAATESQGLGLNVLSGIMDEGNFLEPLQRGQAAQAKYGSKDKAQFLYDQIVRRMRSRFNNKGRMPCLMVLVSSKRTKEDFTARRIRESINDPDVFVRDYCLAGDTRVKLLYGAMATMEELTARYGGSGEYFYVYSNDPVTGLPVPGRAHHPRLTAKDDPVVKVTLDNGTSVRCTPSHPFLLHDGVYLRADELQFGYALRSHGEQRFVGKVEYDGVADVYDLSVDKYENFALNAGVFVHNSTWDVAPHKFSKERFHVLVGNETMPSRIIPDEELKEMRERLVDNEDGLEIIDVPIDFRPDFENDIDNALRDIGGVETVSISPFIPQRDKILTCIDKNRKHPYTVVEWDQSKSGTFIWERFASQVKVRDGAEVFDGWQPLFHPQAVRHVHIDPSHNDDATGFCMGCIVGYKQVERRNFDTQELYTEAAPVIWIDLMLRIKPPLGGEIDQGQVRGLVYQAQAHGFMVSLVTMDQFNSPPSLQKFRQKGIDAERLSVDRPMDAYETLKAAIYEGRVLMYEYEPLLDELRKLQHDKSKGKVDHPRGGKKDLADALAGVVFSLTTKAHHAPLMISKGISSYGDPDVDDDQKMVESEEFMMPFLI